MSPHILKTNIGEDREVAEITDAFLALKFISSWSIDLEDVDRVMKIHTLKEIDQSEIIGFVRNLGYECMDLSD